MITAQSREKRVDVQKSIASKKDKIPSDRVISASFTVFQSSQKLGKLGRFNLADVLVRKRKA